MKDKIFRYIISWDFLISSAIAVTLYFLFLPDISNTFVKDLSGVGISVLSIVFSVYFAALAIIISSSDDDFIRFLEVKGRYQQITSTFRYSLAVLFLALLYSVFTYANAAILIERKIQSQQNYLFCIFTFAFFYGLLVALSATLDSIRYALTRVKFINKKDEIEARRKDEADRHKKDVS